MSEPVDQPRSGEAPLLTLVSTSRSADAGYLAQARMSAMILAVVGGAADNDR
jgi:hypothetical protein